ncbi:MAG: AAA family ATPase [Nitrospinota bacterium]|nr:AAA family ATPase [Nitrospinota bacterium]
MKPEIFAVAGGKGGVGKSVTSILLARAFSLADKKTVLVDGDLGGANLHTLVGMNYPQYGLIDFLLGRVQSLEDILLYTPDKNVRLISGAGDFLGMANLKWTVKAKLIRHLKNLDADRVIIDLGAGASFNTLDLFLTAKKHVVVLSPEPTSLQNLCEFLKYCVGRLLYAKFSKDEKVKLLLDRFVFPNRPDSNITLGEFLEKLTSGNNQLSREINTVLQNFQPYVVVSMAENQAEATKYFNMVEKTAKKYFKMNLSLLCTVFREEIIHDYIRNSRSLFAIDTGANHYSLMKMGQVLNRKTSRLVGY